MQIGLLRGDAQGPLKAVFCGLGVSQFGRDHRQPVQRRSVVWLLLQDVAVQPGRLVEQSIGFVETRAGQQHAPFLLPGIESLCVLWQPPQVDATHGGFRAR